MQVTYGITWQGSTACATRNGVVIFKGTLAQALDSIRRVLDECTFGTRYGTSELRLRRSVQALKDRQTNAKPQTRPRTFYTIDNVGSTRYTVNYHDGHKTHEDGSAFFDIRLFSNRRKRDAFIKDLRSQGYTERH